MKIDLQQMGSVKVVCPHGAIASDDVEIFIDSVQEQIYASGGRMVLDFANVAFLDSRGVEALWDIADAQQDNGQPTRVAAVPEICREIFELTGVSDHLDIYDSCESAVRSFL